MVIEAAVGALAAELLKALTSEVGKDAYKKGKDIIASLRKRFTQDPKAVEVLSKYEQAPLLHDTDFRRFLTEMAHSDPEFANVLKTTAGQFAVAQTTTIGTQNVHNEIVHGSKTTSTISAGRDVIQVGDAFRKEGEAS
ncbi:hypothetical protein [Bradyrhizobium sp. Cp5.3]|uniref:hypothetical protein n=1 Tax=Bradyrhizobium sp. Cp5.3 TaxID=443598 RepID=UPI0003F8588E|nr:hypothetical protein [Bradyrhizobium sp. Cp5.3]